MPRKLEKLKVNFISLVKMPANEKGLVLKANEKATQFEILKTNDDQMRAYGIVYAPDQVDAQGDYADSETILKAANDFMLSGLSQNVDRNHDFAVSGAYVAESWIVKGKDPVFPDEKPGAWAVGIQIQDDRTWENLKKGELSGLSLAGTAEAVEKQSEETAIFKWLKNIFKTQNQGVIDMTKEETQAMIDKAMEGQNEILKGISERLEKMAVDAEPEPDPEKDKEPEKKPEVESHLEKAFQLVNDKLDELSKVVLSKGASTTGTGMDEPNEFEDCV